MTKTPEEMAEEYCNTKQLSYVERLVITKGFIDGYQAATVTTKSPKKLDSLDDIDLEQRVAALEGYVKVAQERILYLNQVVRLLLDNAGTKKTFGGAGTTAIRTKLLDDYMEDKHRGLNKDYGSGY